MNQLQFFGAVQDPPVDTEPRAIGWAARAGLAARGTTYLLLAALTVSLALGNQEEADQTGALQELVSRPWGSWLVGLLAVGFACYALWRFSEAVFGVTGEGDGPGPRLFSVARGVVYVFLAWTAVSLLLGRGSENSQGLLSQVMAETWGRWLVGIAGVGVLVAGAVLAWKGAHRSFLRYFRSPPNVVTVVGTIGNTARGVVVAIVGVCVVVAAWTYDPEQADGLDGALKTLREQPYGPYLLVLAALGLAAFGVYGLLESRYRDV